MLKVIPGNTEPRQFTSRIWAKIPSVEHRARLAIVVYQNTERTKFEIVINNNEI